MPRLPLRAHLAGALLVFCLASLGFQADGAATTAPAAATQALAEAVEAPAERYGLWVLMPPVVAIVLAIAFRAVIPALVIGVLVGAFMMVPCLPADEAYGGGVIGGLRLAAERYFVQAIAGEPGPEADHGHAIILIFSLTIAGMVGIIGANGGTGAVVNSLARYASTQRRGQVVTWFAGLLVFFDDYANAMIVGPSMRPVTDRLRISRAKLAYIVDSTAAPVSSIALIGTWIGAEVGYIQDGLDQLPATPGFLEGATAYSIFLGSLQYRFYAVFALVMVLWIALLGRDFGPMLKAERAAAANGAGGEQGGATGADPVGKAWYAVVPVLLLVAVTLVVLFETGRAAVTDRALPWGAFLRDVVSNADAYNSIYYGALASIAAAILISVTAARQKLSETVDAATSAMGRVFPTFIVLILAWALSDVMKSLQLGEVAVAWLEARRAASQFDVRLLPALVFGAACVVSFAMGSSWGTMGILCPAAVTIAAGLVGDLPGVEGETLFYASVGAVLAGAIFGDHCSPISDTTVLSSLACECSLEQHVWTQMPYAVVVMLVSFAAGDYLVHFTGQPWWVALLAGSVGLLAVVLIAGRRSGVAAVNYR